MNKRIYRYRTAREIAKGVKVASCKLGITNDTVTPATVTLGGAISTSEGRLWRRFIQSGTLVLAAPSTTAETVYIEDENGTVHEAAAYKLTFTDTIFPYPRNYRKRVNMWKWLKQQETDGNFYIADADVDTDNCYVYYYAGTTSNVFGVVEGYLSTGFSAAAEATENTAGSLTISLSSIPATARKYKYRYRSTTGTKSWSSSLLATVSEDSFTINDLTEAAPYVIEVTAYDSTDHLLACAYTTGTTSTFTIVVEVTADTEGSLTVTASNLPSTATTYKYEYKTGQEAYNTPTIITLADYTFTIGSLTTSNAYSIRLTAYNSSAAEVGTAETTYTPPDATPKE